jgi:hypothetical protein
LDDRKENNPVNIAIRIAGAIVRNKETPADLMLDSSYLSERFPNTMIDEMSTVNGIAIGIMVMAK